MRVLTLSWPPFWPPSWNYRKLQNFTVYCRIIYIKKSSPKQQYRICCWSTSQDMSIFMSKWVLWLPSWPPSWKCESDTNLIYYDIGWPQKPFHSNRYPICSWFRSQNMSIYPNVCFIRYLGRHFDNHLGNVKCNKMLNYSVAFVDLKNSILDTKIVFVFDDVESKYVPIRVLALSWPPSWRPSWN